MRVLWDGSAAMKILQINNVYGIGSTGKLTAILHDAIREDGFESVVLYGRGTTARADGVTRICGDFYGKANSLLSRVSGIRYGGCLLSTSRAINLIKKEMPDIVHLQCINGNFVNIYRLVGWLKKHKIPTVLTLHAEFMYTANCSHAFDCERWRVGCGDCPRPRAATKSFFGDNTRRSFRKMKEAFDGFEDGLRVVSVSPWVMERAKQSPILEKMSHEVILNGVDTDIFRPRTQPLPIGMPRIDGRATVFHVTPNFTDRTDDPKGGCYVIELARRLRDSAIIVVAGKHDVSCELPDNLVLLGQVTDQNLLASYYSAADVTVTTSRRETFSMVCAESLCCGTPIVGFCAGAPEMISLPAYSRFVAHGDTDALERAVREFLADDAMKNREEIARSASAAYAKEHMIAQYEKLYRRTKWSESD